MDASRSARFQQVQGRCYQASPSLHAPVAGQPPRRPPSVLFAKPVSSRPNSQLPAHADREDIAVRGHTAQQPECRHASSVSLHRRDVLNLAVGSCILLQQNSSKAEVTAEPAAPVATPLVLPGAACSCLCIHFETEHHGGFPKCIHAFVTFLNRHACALNARQCKRLLPPCATSICGQGGTRCNVHKSCMLALSVYFKTYVNIVLWWASGEHSI